MLKKLNILNNLKNKLNNNKFLPNSNKNLIDINSKDNFAFYKICCDDGMPNNAVAVYDIEMNDISDDYLLYCKKINIKKDYLFRFTVDTKTERLEKWDFIYNNAFVLLVNEKALNFLLELCHNDFEYFNALIKTRDGEIKDYKVINILSLEDLLDWDKTESNYLDDGKFISVISPVFKTDFDLHNVNLFRIKECLSSVYCSVKFFEEYNKRSLKGLRFDAMVRFPTGIILERYIYEARREIDNFNKGIIKKLDPHFKDFYEYLSPIERIGNFETSVNKTFLKLDKSIIQNISIDRISHYNKTDNDIAEEMKLISMSGKKSNFTTEQYRNEVMKLLKREKDKLRFGKILK